MRILFEIEEKLPDIISEILESEEWQSVVEVDHCKFKKLVLKDLFFDAMIFVEIWEKEVHLKTPQAEHTYRILERGGKSVCEYIGTIDGVLKQHPFPKITPLKNLQLACEEEYGTSKVSNIYRNFRNYALNDDFIKDGIPIPAIGK